VARAIVRTPEARRDTVRIYVWLALKSDDLGDRFLVALEAAYERAAGMPGIGAPVEGLPPRLAGLRCLSVDGFPNHLVFYRETPEGVEILRILHAARNLTSALLGEEPD
jgi:toxin ParE1/3/4